MGEFIELTAGGAVFGFGSGLVGYASSRGGQLFYWTEDILLCETHAPPQWLPMQPYTTFDREQGYGKRGCPFCPGGELARQSYRSLAAFEQALKDLAATPYSPTPKPSKEECEQFQPIDKLLRLMHDHIVVNLWLTEQCNFECGHCFYMMSPRSPKGYMSDEMLAKLRGFVLTLREKYRANVDVNLIGGEPTLNLKEFKRCLDYVMQWQNDTSLGGISFEMTTNGWWLSKPKWTVEFFEAVLPHVAEEYGDGLIIRVSDDSYHMPFRPGFLKNKRVKPVLGELLENGRINDEPVFWSETAVCECGYEGSYYEWNGCPKCGKEDWTDIKEEYLLSHDIPSVEEGAPWIYADQPDIQRFSRYDKGRQDDYSWVVPSNDGCDWGKSDKGARGQCHTGVQEVTFDPKGVHRDGCCSGSDMQFSTIDDDPLVVLGLNNTFTRTSQPTCRSCRSEAEAYKDSELAKRARAFYEEAAATMQFLEEDDEGNVEGEDLYQWREPWMERDEVMEATAREVGA
jgi:hypothetical protein